MKIPLKWLENYIKLEHSPEEFGNIMTFLEFMQDGPIETVNGQLVIDLEVRQNRPDMLSVIGAAREYAAYINKKLKYPEQLEFIPVPVQEPKELIKVKSPEGMVKRFYAVYIRGVKPSKSPKWLTDNLKAYGIPPVNNLVDITNYVLVEYGIPMHCFDFNKLKKSRSDNEPIINIRMGKKGDKFTTWLGDEILPTNKDIVLTDSADKIVGIGGIIGEKTTGTTEKTRNIVLEAANYSYATTRRSALAHNLMTESAIRHSKILPSNMVEIAIKRALWLIKELAGGEIIRIEDFYPQREEIKLLDFDINEITRLSGLQFSIQEVKDLLQRLEIEVVETIGADAIGKNILKCRIPIWRTDLNYEEDLIEEVLRLNGYDKIPFQKIASPPPDYGTPASYVLEDKIRNILTGLGLDEHITVPLVKFSSKESQIKLENPLNAEMSGLRTTIRETLKVAVDRGIKAKKNKIAVFEVGKIYKQIKVGEYKEIKQVETLYHGYTFDKKIKPDLLAVLRSLGLANLVTKQQKQELTYYVSGKLVATLRRNGFTLFTENLTNFVDVQKIPHYSIQTSLPQVIVEDISLLVKPSTPIGDIASYAKSKSKFISQVIQKDSFKLDDGKISVTLSITFVDTAKNLRREDVAKIKEEILKGLKKKYKVKLR